MSIKKITLFTSTLSIALLGFLLSANTALAIATVTPVQVNGSIRYSDPLISNDFPFSGVSASFVREGFSVPNSTTNELGEYLFSVPPSIFFQSFIDIVIPEGYKLHEGQSSHIPVVFTYTEVPHEGCDCTDRKFDDISIPTVVLDMTTIREIQIVGDPVMEVFKGSEFTDPGATVKIEGKDTSVPIVASSTVDISKIGSYTITYSCNVPNACNTAVRTVNVVVDPNEKPPVEEPVTPTPDPVTPPLSHGGGIAIGSIAPIVAEAPVVGEVLGANTECRLLSTFMKKDFNNDKVEVLKLQTFLFNQGYTDVKATGIFDDATEVAVRKFQDKYKKDIIFPYKRDKNTGFVYILTQKKINEIYCGMAFPITKAQQDEITAFGNVGEVFGVSTSAPVKVEVVDTPKVEEKPVSFFEKIKRFFFGK